MWRFCVSRFQRFDFCLFFQRKQPNVCGHILVAAVEPELVEFVWGCFIPVEPDVATLAFSELRTVGFFNEWSRQCKRFSLCFSSNDFCSGRDISPLVGTTHLQFAVLQVMQVVKIIPLNKLVAKLG